MHAGLSFYCLKQMDRGRGCHLASATTGRGTSNIYLIDTATMAVIGNQPNPHVSDMTNRERLTSGILVGREPHEPTFTRNGKEIWVTVRGEDRIAIVDVALARRESAGERTGAQRGFFKPSTDRRRYGFPRTANWPSSHRRRYRRLM
jgi:hypothetical protein